MEVAIISCTVSIIGLFITIFVKVITMTVTFTKLQTEVKEMRNNVELTNNKQEQDINALRALYNQHDVLLNIQQTKLDNIEKNVETINLKLDKLLQRN